MVKSAIIDPRKDRCAREMLISECPPNTIIGSGLLNVVPAICAVGSVFFVTKMIVASGFSFDYSNKKSLKFLVVFYVANLFTAITFILPTITKGQFSNNLYLPLFIYLPDFLYLFVHESVIILIGSVNKTLSRFLMFVLKGFISVYSIAVFISILIMLGLGHLIYEPVADLIWICRYFHTGMRVINLSVFLYSCANAFIFNNELGWVMPMKMQRIMLSLVFFVAFLMVFQLIVPIFVFYRTVYVWAAMDYNKYRPIFTNYIGGMNFLILVVPNIVLLKMISSIGAVQEEEPSSSLESSKPKVSSSLL